MDRRKYHILFKDWVRFENKWIHIEILVPIEFTHKLLIYINGENVKTGDDVRFEYLKRSGKIIALA